MILPPFVGALSMRHLLSRFGAINLLLERLGIGAKRLVPLADRLPVGAAQRGQHPRVGLDLGREFDALRVDEVADLGDGGTRRGICRRRTERTEREHTARAENQQ